MTGFVYRPRPVVSIASKDRLRQARGHVQQVRRSSTPGVARCGGGWHARVVHEGQVYQSQIFAREDLDEETGLSHLWHAVCCIAFLIAFEQRGIGTDDRPTR